MLGNTPEPYGKIGNPDACPMMVVRWRQDISISIPKVITLDFTLNLRYFYTETLDPALNLQTLWS